MNVVWFDQPARADEIGGKGYKLCRLAYAGLPVPRGFCISASGLESISPGDIELLLLQLGAHSVAVRSSAVGEDDDVASFAGIYSTRLNISNVKGILDALDEIGRSVMSPAAEAYRQRRAIRVKPKMAAIVQEFLNPEASGVLFMRDPLGGMRRIVVEGSWGLGEAVVGGRVTPDRWVLSPEGNIISMTISDKDVAIVPEHNGTTEIEVDSVRRKQACLDENSLRQLMELAIACESLLGSPQDIEWATASNKVWLLQSRPITVGGPHPALRATLSQRERALLGNRFLHR
jgi:phosphoenolpyruvate synthase/pyruvate phosphate dikinase